MENTTYNIIFRGEIVKGQDIEEVKKNLASLFKVGDDKIEQLFLKQGGRIKKDVDRLTSIKYKTAMEKAGALCSIVPCTVNSDNAATRKSYEQQDNTEQPEVKTPEPDKTSPLSIPQTLKVITPERTMRNLLFSPLECPSISRAGEGLNFNRVDVQNVSFENIMSVSVFGEEVSNFMEYYLVLFLKNFKRPFILPVDRIRYHDFRGIKKKSALNSLRNFIIFLCNKNPDLIIDNHTYEFLNGNEQNLLKVEPLDFITSLGKTLKA